MYVNVQKPTPVVRARVPRIIRYTPIRKIENEQKIDAMKILNQERIFLETIVSIVKSNKVFN